MGNCKSSACSAGALPADSLEVALGGMRVPAHARQTQYQEEDDDDDDDDLEVNAQNILGGKGKENSPKGKGKGVKMSTVQRRRTEMSDRQLAESLALEEQEEYELDVLQTVTGAMNQEPVDAVLLADEDNTKKIQSVSALSKYFLFWYNLFIFFPPQTIFSAFDPSQSKVRFDKRKAKYRETNAAEEASATVAAVVPSGLGISSSSSSSPRASPRASPRYKVM